jgi:hypothetical protein
MKKFLLKTVLYCLCMAYYPLNAQNNASIEIGIPYTPNVSFVYGLDYHPQWYTQLKPAVGLAFGGGGGSIDWSAAMLNFTVEQRYYYNMPKRQEQGKRTDFKSANFISLRPSVYYPCFFSSYKPVINDSFTCTVNWGMRRAVGKSCYFDGSFGYGPAYLKSNKSWDGLFAINLGFGVAFNKQ